MAAVQLRELSLRISKLEIQLKELEIQSQKKDEELEHLQFAHEPSYYEQMFDLEKTALMLQSTCTIVNFEDIEAFEMANMLGSCQYEKVVYETQIGSELFARDPLNVSLEHRIERLIENEPFGGLKIMFLGAALLQLFIQSNWTGPPVACLSDKRLYPLMFLPREDEIEDENEAIASLELEVKATAAASGKDKTVKDLEMFPRTHAKCIRQLEINGETIVESAKGMHFLSVANDLLTSAANSVRATPLTSHWWLARCATVWQESLNSREVAFDLKRDADREFEKCFVRLSTFLSQRLVHDDANELLGMLFLERGVSAHKFHDPSRAKTYFTKALEVLNLNVQLSGALGKRTKFQLEEKSQLILLARSERTKSPEKHEEQTTTPLEDGEAAGFGTRMEAGHVKVRIEELDEDTPLHERVQITDTGSETFEKERKGHLSEIGQIAILDLCIDVKNSYAMERLTAEEMLAYCERVTENPDNWTIHGCALLIKSKLEFERYKTKERSVLQMQMLVDQQTNRLTPLQHRIQDIEETTNKPIERLKYVHALVWPPIWRLKRGLADRYRELGVVVSALNLYQELRMWEDAVACLIQMDKRHRAETLIRERLSVAPTPSLYVALGELTNDESLLEKAWEMSNFRYARAKRLLGARVYDRGEYEGARKHLRDALEVNAQFPWAWFRLGAASMKLEDWSSAKRAYAQVVSIEPEDAEAWANLSASLSKLGETHQAFIAIQEAAKYGFGNSRIWDSFLTLAIHAQQWDSALLAMDTLIDLEGRKAGAPTVDVRALLPITEVAMKTPSFRARYEQLIAKIKSKCQSQADVWAIVAEYYSVTNQLEEKRDAILRRCRAFMKEIDWFKNSTVVSKLIATSLVLCNSYVDATARQKQEVMIFVNGFVEKINLPILSMKEEELQAVQERLTSLKAIVEEFNKRN